MKEITINSVQEFNDMYGIETLHPLVSVARVTEPKALDECLVHYGVYALYLKENKGCILSYGRTPYDFDEMTVTSFAPGQTVHVEPNPAVPIPVWTALIFHPDFLKRTALGRQMSRYEFFDYSSSEALHLSTAEVEVFRGVLAMISQELQHPIDKHTRELIVSNIELLLNYCLRFYDRQFITREEINHSVVKKFEMLLKDFILSEASQKGLPTVAYFAEKCCLSTPYFGELVKVETGSKAQDIIADRLMDRAKELLEKPTLSISQVAMELGFAYPQHFTRFFKRHSGVTPGEWRTA
ncbi:MAG: helix-turn-helix transcriptional regulator [Bacteroidales bacterium]|nr:helix-turn-helix transcriptional regulator [Bacteroidales bacterium]